MSTATQTQATQQELSTGGHLAPYAVAEAAWATGQRYALSYCGKGRVRIGRKETANIVGPGGSPREFCAECVAVSDRAILEDMLESGSLDE